MSSETPVLTAESFFASYAPRRPAMTLGRSIWFVSLALLVIFMCLDPKHIFTRGALKQVPLLLSLGVTALALWAGRSRIERPAFPGLCFGLLLVYAAPGLLLNKLDHAESSLFSAVSMLSVPLSVYALPRSWLRCNGRQMLNWLGVVAAAYVVGAAVQLFLNRRGLVDLRIHERAFLAPLVVLVPILLRRRLLAFLGCSSVAAILLMDPRTTLLIALMLTGGAGLYFFKLNAQARRFALTMACCLAGFSAVAGPTILRLFDAQYKAIFGMKGNSDFRSNLLATGLKMFAESPFYGDGFRGPTSFYSGFYERGENGGWQAIMAPLHNDYLEFLTKGGVIGGALLVAGLAGTVVLAAGNIKRYRALGQTDLANWQAVLCVAVMSLMFTILVNPVLNNPVCGLPALLLVAQVFAGHRYARQLQWEGASA
jgi:O-antigen ligase